jgi:ABC-type xylose transport system permease subunit
MKIKENLDVILYVAVILFMLVHEYIKEGYFFKLSDVIKFPTHESIILIITIIFVIYKIACRLKERKN